jgi:hypothetical protein
MKGNATFEWRSGNKYWIEPKGLQQAFVNGTLRSTWLSLVSEPPAKWAP